MGNAADLMSTDIRTDPILKRYRAALDKLVASRSIVSSYSGRAHAAIHGRIPIMTSLSS
jgi:hypothetical protein